MTARGDFRLWHERLTILAKGIVPADLAIANVRSHTDTALLTRLRANGCSRIRGGLRKVPKFLRIEQSDPVQPFGHEHTFGSEQTPPFLHSTSQTAAMMRYNGNKRQWLFRLLPVSQKSPVHPASQPLHRFGSWQVPPCWHCC